jgi:F0F1-type ATP synthase assembly protein I
MPGPAFYARIGRLSSIIFVLPSCMAAGGGLGYYLVDRYFGTYPWGMVVFVLLGAVAGFYEIFKILAQDQAQNQRSKS